jgi:hypothetical protein
MEMPSNILSRSLTSPNLKVKQNSLKLVLSGFYAHNIKISIANNFSSKDYESLNYALYESVRHEIEHNESYMHLGKPKRDYINLFNRSFNDDMDLRSHCKTVSEYILHPHELPSYAKSIYYYAKKSKLEFNNVIVNVLNRAFFNNDVTKIKNGMSDYEIKLMFEKVQFALSDSIHNLFPDAMIRTTFI